MTRFLRFSLVALTLAALCSPSYAGVRYFLSTSNTVPGGGVPGAPDLPGLAANAEVDLYVWAKFDASSTTINGYSLDIAATTPGVVEAVSSEILNPQYWSRLVFQGNVLDDSPTDPAEFRWPADNPELIAIEPQMNTNGALVYGGAYGIVTGRGIDKARGRPTGNGVYDPSYDGTNQAFLVQSLKLRVLPGSEGLSTGLVMSVGQKAMGIDNSTVPVPVFFGAGTTSARHDVVGATDGSIHATLSVAGSSRTNVFELGGDPTGATSVPFAGVQPVDLPIGSPAGKLLIDDAWLRNGNFEVYFDLSFSDPGTDVNDVIALLQGQSIDALPGRSLGNGIAYDLRIVVPGTPGNDLLLDFDFSAGGLAGVSVESVGVPEPSTFVLAGLGCVGLLAFRRRKA